MDRNTTQDALELSLAEVNLDNLMTTSQHEGVRMVLLVHETSSVALAPESLEAGSVRFLDIRKVGDGEDHVPCSEPEREHSGPESGPAAIPDPDSRRLVIAYQTPNDISLNISLHKETNPFAKCELYYDNMSSQVALRNTGDARLWVNGTTRHPSEDQVELEIERGLSAWLSPGTYTIVKNERCILELRVLARMELDSEGLKDRPSVLLAAASLKRPLEISEGEHLDPPNPFTRRMGPSGQAINFPSGQLAANTNTGDLFLPSRQSATGNPVLELLKESILHVPKVLNWNSYQLQKHDVISTRRQSDIYKGTHSDIPNTHIVIKVVKTWGNGDSQAAISNARAWQQESLTHAALKHNSIVAFYGSDARFLTLYLEHILASDLSHERVWRDANTSLFCGSNDDAMKICIEIGSALQYVHRQGISHNDIKPGNILYSKERGALLCDFGLARPSTVHTPGGTPPYVPPEYMNTGRRGNPGDMFAFGVTMAYLLKQLRWPEQASYFQISHIRGPVGSPEWKAAREAMNTWQKMVGVASSTCDNLVQNLLRPEPSLRSTAAGLLEDLKGEGWGGAALISESYLPDTGECTNEGMGSTTEAFSSGFEVAREEELQARNAAEN
ncbi:kinase-like domain-containing protein [Leptodontidium sp. 2 PMI_412]|nr:kinase-like domain-containing protein [Leptodontidium sp. 2 PMI_412]